MILSRLTAKDILGVLFALTWGVLFLHHCCFGKVFYVSAAFASRRRIRLPNWLGRILAGLGGAGFIAWSIMYLRQKLSEGP